ncbi:MAG: class I SAM-dependent methyltransferase [Pirellulales bacterium]|nr:class I SAM-dependent methyltransferase [Pirellulales bacterium]
MTAIIDHFFSTHVRRLTDALEELDRRIDPDSEPTSEGHLAEVSGRFQDALAECNKLQAQLADEDPQLLKDTQARFREVIFPWGRKSWVMNRSMTKPRGYPGDYQLLTAIYNRVPKSKGLGGYIDRYLLDFTLAQAVIGRMFALRDFLVSEFGRRSGKVSALDVACGACRELTEDFHIPRDTYVSLTCVDNDDEALDYVRDHVAPAVPENLAMDFVRYNALRMTSASANIKRFGRSDLIYSVGLCDYIPDEYLIPLLKGWRESTHDGGIVYVAFKDCRRYDTAEYQWLLDWYFFQRTEEECTALYEKAGYDMDAIATTRDSTGVIINYIARCNAPVEIRVDQPQGIPVAQTLNGIETAAAIPIAGG